MRKTLSQVVVALVVSSVLIGGIGGIASAQIADTTVEFENQALAPDDTVTVTVTGSFDSGDEGYLGVTYNDSDGNTILAGYDNISQTGTYQVTLDTQNLSDGVPPGVMTAHLFTSTDVNTTAIGTNMTVDPSTTTGAFTAAPVDNSQATVYDGEISMVSSDLEGDVGTINVTNVSLNEGNDQTLVDIGVVIHESEEGSSVINTSDEAIIGSSNVIDESASDVEITLNDGESVEVNETYHAVVYELNSDSVTQDGSDTFNPTDSLNDPVPLENGLLSDSASTSNVASSSGDGIELPVVGSVTPLQLGLVFVAILLLIGGGYWYTEEYNATVEHY